MSRRDQAAGQAGFPSRLSTTCRATLHSASALWWSGSKLSRIFFTTTQRGSKASTIHPSPGARHSSLRETHLAHTWLLTLLPPVLWRTRHFHYCTVVVSVRGLSTKTSQVFQLGTAQQQAQPPCIKAKVRTGLLFVNNRLQGAGFSPQRLWRGPSLSLARTRAGEKKIAS